MASITSSFQSQYIFLILIISTSLSTLAIAASDYETFLRDYGYVGFAKARLVEGASDDQVLGLAIRTYQGNYALTVTGILDDPTKQHMMRPRCGVPDIVGGVNTMDRLLSDRVLRGFLEGRPRFPLTNLGYTLQSNFLDEAKAMIRGAFDRWSGVSKLRFYETPPYILHYIIVGFFSGDHNDAGQFDGRGRILGHAFAPESGRRVHFNVDQPWSFNPPPYAEGYYDFMTAALHEIGHALGLEHSGDRSAIVSRSSIW